MTWLRQSTAATIKLGPFVDSTDGVTAETALTISQADVRLSKNGGDFAQKSDEDAATHDEAGYYDVALDATDTGTLGRLRVAVSESGALPVWADFEVVPAQVWDSYFASDRLQVDTREFGDSNLALTTQMKADVNAEAVIDTEAIADAVADVVGDTVAGDVWSHSPRTLTQIGVAPGTTTTAETISRRRGDSWEIAISGLAMEGWQELWFTVKRGYEYADPNALLQITLTGGLVRLNGAAAEAGDAALAITGTHDAATITVRAEATAQLPTGTFVYDLQWMDSAGDIHTVSLGTFTVSSDVTRATS